MKNDERRWLFLFGLVILLVTSLPYLLGYQQQGDQWYFTGFVFGADDGNSYIAKMLRGATGDWLFRTPYTAYPQNGLLAFLPYLLLGKLTASPAQHEQLVWLFHAFRWIGGFVMLAGTYRFMSMFLENTRFRKTGAALAILGGGLGWLYAFGFSKPWGIRLPLEFYSPESFGFLSLFGLPHLAMERGLLLLGMVFFLKAVTSGKDRPAIAAGLVWLVMGFFQPLSVATAWAVLGMAVLINAAYQVYKKNRVAGKPNFWLRPLLITGLISSPLLIYNLIISFSDSFMQLWSQQNIILSPPPGDYLLAYLPFLLLAIPGIPVLVRQNPSGAMILFGWLAAFPFLAYAPYSIQRRLPEGIWVALVVLALAGFEQIHRKRLRTILHSAIYTAYLPAVILLAGAVFSVWKPAGPLFIPVQQAQAYLYLNENAPRNSVVLADFAISNALPAWAPVFTLTGHGPESIHADEIQPAVEQFFDPHTPDSIRLDLLRRFDVDYVLARSQDNWHPDQSPDRFEPVFQQEDVIVYRVDLSSP